MIVTGIFSTCLRFTSAGDKQKTRSSTFSVQQRAGYYCIVYMSKYAKSIFLLQAIETFKASSVFFLIKKDVYGGKSKTIAIDKNSFCNIKHLSVIQYCHLFIFSGII